MLFSDANSVHTSWLTERHASATFATTQETYEQALATGFAPERQHLVGWPMRTQFFQTNLSNQENMREQRTRLHLDLNRLTIFLQGGGEGSARIANTIENILTNATLKNVVQVILAAGTNRNLFARYQHVPNVAVLPHTNDMASYMAAADIVMGKAGPNILFETVMQGKPFLATTCIPGQEQENLAFIQRHGLGWIALQPEDQRTLLLELLYDPAQRSSLIPQSTPTATGTSTPTNKSPTSFTSLSTSDQFVLPSPLTVTKT